MEQGQQIDLNGQVVMPTHDDLLKAKQYGFLILKFSKYAVFVRKISSKKRSMVLDKRQIPTTKNLISSYARDFSYDFLVDFQFRDGMILTKEELSYTEKVQQIPELSKMCMLEASPKQTAQELDNQIQEWKRRNPEKNIIVVSEVYTNEMANKVAIAKRNGLKEYAIKFRSYRKHQVALSKFLATLRRVGLYSLVFGVQPNRWKATQASMLLPSLYFKCNAVSRWIAWGGRKTHLTLLCEDWKYHGMETATGGFTDYNGQNRLQLVSTNVQSNSAFGKIDTINQANLMVWSVKALTKIQVERLFQ